MKKIEILKFKLKRFFRSLRYGFFYTGFKNFHPPKKILTNLRYLHVNIPHDQASYQSFIEIFLDDTYQLRRANDLPRQSVIVDIGGNIGLFSIYAKSIYKYSRVYSIEPNHKVLPSLMKNSKKFDFEVFPVAICKTHQKVKVLDSIESHLMARTLDDPSGHQTGVPFESIFENVGGKIDFLKMDGEGAEWSVFESDIDWSRVRYISFEYHEFGKGKKLANALDNLKNTGFEVIDIQSYSNYGMIFAKNRDFCE
jgi:FkbM family methyltransferase